MMQPQTSDTSKNSDPIAEWQGGAPNNVFQALAEMDAGGYRKPDDIHVFWNSEQGKGHTQTVLLKWRNARDAYDYHPPETWQPVHDALKQSLEQYTDHLAKALPETKPLWDEEGGEFNIRFNLQANSFEFRGYINDPIERPIMELTGQGKTIGDAMQKAMTDPEKSTISAIEKALASIDGNLTGSDKLSYVTFFLDTPLESVSHESVQVTAKLHRPKHPERYIEQDMSDEVKFPVDVFRRMVRAENIEMYGDNISAATMTITLGGKYTPHAWLRSSPNYTVDYEINTWDCSQQEPTGSYDLILDDMRGVEQAKELKQGRHRSKDAKPGNKTTESLSP